MRYIALIACVIVLTSGNASAEYLEFYVGGGSSECLVQCGGPQGLTIIPVGEISDDGDHQVLQAIFAAGTVGLGIGLICIILIFTISICILLLICWAISRLTYPTSSA